MDQKTTRGKKWSDDEIKSMLQVALEININELFDSHRLSNRAVFNELGKKFTEKDVNQIKIKYDSLRRWFCSECSSAKKSGAGAKTTTIYDDEMYLLWGKRKKITVPIEYGVDTSEFLDTTSTISTEDIKNLANSDIVTDPITPALTPAKNIKTGKKKTKQQHDMHFFLQELKEQDAEIMEQIAELQKNAEKKADERLDKLLKAVLQLMCQSTYANPPMYFSQMPQQRMHQIFVPSASPSTDSTNSFSFEQVFSEENLIVAE